MDSEKIAIKCRSLNAQHGLTHSAFVAVFVFSTTSLYFFVVSPLLKSVLSEDLVGYLLFAIPVAFILFGRDLLKQDRCERFLEKMYQTSKFQLTCGTLLSWVVLSNKTRIIEKVKSYAKK